MNLDGNHRAGLTSRGVKEFVEFSQVMMLPRIFINFYFGDGNDKV